MPVLSDEELAQYQNIYRNLPEFFQELLTEFQYKMQSISNAIRDYNPTQKDFNRGYIEVAYSPYERRRIYLASKEQMKKKAEELENGKS